MGETTQNIIDIARELWQGRRAPLSADLDLAESALSSSESLERIAGIMVLLISQTNRIPVERICAGIRDMCHLASQTSSDLFYSVTSTIVMLPEELVLQDAILKRFMYRALFSESSATRCNATLMLGRLAEKGDPNSVVLLGIAKNDEDYRVAANARACLEDLARQGKPSAADGA